MSSGSLNDIVTLLSDTFSQSELTPTSIEDLKQSLSTLTLKARKNDVDTATRLQHELINLYKGRVETDQARLGPFMSVLDQVRPLLAADDVVYWFNNALLPFVHLESAWRSSLDDAEDFVVQAMAYDDDSSDARERARTCSTLAATLLDAYMSRTALSTPESQQNPELPLRTRARAAQQLQKMLVAFGHKRAKDFFLAIDNYLVVTDTRFRALSLLAAFLEEQQAHLYLVVHTAVVEHLLKCLMNDTATLVVSAALRCLIMLLPHIPATVATQLPRLFLVYSRFLCWEKFSASSTKAQRDLVTDDRLPREDESDYSDDEEDGSDPTWTTLHPLPDMPESTAPDLLHYFTYLYGLYPLSFMSYIRKPRKYLKNLDFPGANEFDLDQAVIRTRTEQFQRLHLLHPSFFNATVEDEIAENRWLKAEPSEVIAECLGLYVGQRPALASPGPPPTSDLPALPLLMTLDQPRKDVQADSDADPTTPVSPAASHKSQPGPSPVKETSSPDTPVASSQSTAISLTHDVTQLQRELMSLRNELTFERYLKHQHVAAIGQLRRNHIKAVTIEAETATLINANRALRKKLGDAIRFNEKMQKETQARRTHTKQSEEQLTAKIRSLKADLTNQEALQRDLEQASRDCDQLRLLLVESEARELSKQEELESLRGNADEVERLRAELSELSRQTRMHRQRELHAETTEAEQEMTKQELDSTKTLLKNRELELERAKRMFETRTTELVARLEMVTSNHDNATIGTETSPSTAEMETMLAHARAKLTQTKRAYAQLLDDYTDLRIRYQELVAGVNHREPRMPMEFRQRKPSLAQDYNALDRGGQDYDRNNMDPMYYKDRRSFESPNIYDHQRLYPQPSAMMPDHRLNPPMPSGQYQQHMMAGGPPFHGNSNLINDGYSQHTAAWGAAPSSTSDYESGAPSMMREVSKSAFSVSEDGRSSIYSKKGKSKPEVRVVYGRGGAQNMKIKNKNKTDKTSKSGGILGIKGIM